MAEINLDGISFGTREINEMIQLISRYDASDKIFVISLVDNGLDDDNINLLLQLVFSLPYLRRLDLRKNSFSNAGIKRLTEQLKTMEGITAVIPTASQVLNVHSGNQLRICVDTSEQMPKDQVAKDVDFTVQQELSHVDADGFLSTNAGASSHPWTKTAANQSPQAQVAQGGATPGAQGGATPGLAAEQEDNFGGPPVGLGGPGNVAALNKKNAKGAQGKNRLPDPKKRQANRAKAAPPAALDMIPSQRVVDKWQSGATSSLPLVTPQRSISHSSLRSDREPNPRAQTLDPRLAASMERSSSVPAIRKVMRQSVRSLADVRR